MISDILTKLLSLLLPKDLSSGTLTKKSNLENEIIEHLKLREGVSTKVYKDSLGKLTVGVGHLVLPEDNLKLGDEISMFAVDTFLMADMQKALNAARTQVLMLPVKPSEEDTIIKALTYVNFQLGTAWNKTFKNTWTLMTRGNFKAAAEEIKDSRWYAQTPVRVNDFAKVLLELE